MRNVSFPRQKRALVALIALVLAAAVLRLINLGHYSLWRDEVVIANHVRNAASSGELLESVRVTVGATPLHEFVLSAFLHFGTSDFTARFPSFLAGVASVVAIYFLGRRVFNSQIGLLASLLLTCSRFHIRYSQEARFYAIFVFLTICSMIAFLMFIERRTLLRWIGVVVWHTFCLYSAYFAGFVLLFEGLYAVYLLVRGRIAKMVTPDVSWKTCLASGIGLSLAVLLFLPWFLYAGVSEQVSLGVHTPLNWHWVLSIVEPMSGGSVLSAAVFLAAFVAGTAYWVRLRRHAAVLLVLIAAASPFAVLLLINRSGFFFAPRQVLFALPSFLLLVAAGIAATGDLVGTTIGRFTRRDVKTACAWLIAIVLFVPLDFVDLLQYYGDHRDGLPDWKRAAAYLDENVGKSDLIVSMKALRGGDCLRYYADRELRQRIVDVGDLADWYDHQHGSSWPDGVPSTVWFVALAMPDLDTAEFDVVSFPHLTVVRRKSPPENWDDVWELVADYASKSVRETPPHAGNMLSELSKMLDAVGQAESAYKTAQDMVTRFPQRVSYQRELGQIAVKVGDMAVAEQAFRAALKLDPKSYAFSQLADVLLKTGKPEEAVEVISKAVAAKDEPYRRTWLGKAYDASGKYDLAEKEFRRAIEMEPAYTWAHYELGQFYTARGRLDDAVAEFRTVLRLGPRSSAVGWLADVLLKKRQYDEAEEVVLNAIAVKNDAYRRTTLGLVYLAAGKRDLAEREYRKAIEMEPTYEYAHYRLAQLYVTLGKRDEAIAEFETVLRLVGPDSARAKNVQAELEKVRQTSGSGP